MINFNRTQGIDPTYVDDMAVKRIMTSVFSWMFIGLLCTTVTAFFILSSQELITTVYHSFMIIFILQFVVVIGLSFMIQKISATLAKALFLLYSVLMGATFSALAVVYTGTSIVFALAATAVIFGLMSVYGYVTKEDLTKFGSLLFMGLIFLIVISVVNIFLHSPVLYYIISYVGVILFTALIGFDVNRIKKMALQAQASSDSNKSKLAIIGALTLYLDFINLFIYILRIFGSRR